MRTVKSSKNIYRLSYIILLACIKMVLNACPAAFHEMFSFFVCSFLLNLHQSPNFVCAMAKLKKSIS